MAKARWYPLVNADAVETPLASRPSVRDAERDAITASPSAPPTCCVVLISPEATPESLGATPDIASVINDGNERPAPTPSRSITGKMPVT
jgi:hypothetical protein